MTLSVDCKISVNSSTPTDNEGNLTTPYFVSLYCFYRGTPVITSRGFRHAALRAVYALGLIVILLRQLRKNIKTKCRKRHGPGRGGDTVAVYQPLPLAPMAGRQIGRAPENRHQRSSRSVAETDFER